jgi:hypothetical protein
MKFKIVILECDLGHLKFMRKQGGKNVKFAMIGAEVEAQVVALLPIKLKALNLNPTTSKKIS